MEDQYLKHPGMSQVELLESIHFHDLPVDGFGFSPEYPTSFRLDFATYVDERKDYDHWRIEFDHIERMTVDGFTVDDQSGFEVFSFNYSIGARFEGRFVLLTGAGRPELTITFTSKNYRIARLNG